MVSALPFDDFRRLVASLPDGNDATEREVWDAFAAQDSAAELAGIVELAAWLARWSGRPPRILRPLVAVFAGAHGVARRLAPGEEPKTVHAQVERLGQGGEAVNHICASNDIGLKVFEMALDLPTGDISSEAALEERDCAATMAFGMEAVAGGTDLLCLSGVGVGGATVAKAVLIALHGSPSEAAEARDLPASETEAIGAALALHRTHFGDPFEVLRRLGGREIAAIAGAILAARTEKVPVILEGPAALAAAAVLQAANPEALAHCRLAARSSDPILALAEARLGLSALVNMPLGSPAGAGAAMAAGLLKSVASVWPAMAAA